LNIETVQGLGQLKALLHVSSEGYTNFFDEQNTVLTTLVDSILLGYTFQLQTLYF
jgi:hypothetical protein